MYDFKQLVDKQNWKHTVTGHVIKWSQVRVIAFDGNDEKHLVKLKYEYDGDIQLMDVNSRRGRPVNLHSYLLRNAYQRSPSFETPEAEMPEKTVQETLNSFKASSLLERNYVYTCH